MRLSSATVSVRGRNYETESDNILTVTSRVPLSLKRKRGKERQAASTQHTQCLSTVRTTALK